MMPENTVRKGIDDIFLAIIRFDKLCKDIFEFKSILNGSLEELEKVGIKVVCDIAYETHEWPDLYDGPTYWSVRMNSPVFAIRDMIFSYKNVH